MLHIFDWLIFHYFLKMKSAGLVWKSAAKSNEKLVNQKFATPLHWSYLGSPLFRTWSDFENVFCRIYKHMSYTIEWSLISHSKESNCIQRYVQVLPFLVIVFLFDKDHALFWNLTLFSFMKLPMLFFCFSLRKKDQKIQKDRNILEI